MLPADGRLADGVDRGVGLAANPLLPPLARNHHGHRLHATTSGDTQKGDQRDKSKEQTMHAVSL